MKFGIPQLIATSLASMLYLGSVQAIPLYYTFEGTVSDYPVYDDSGILGDIGLSSGDAVSLSFMIDRDLQGTFRSSSGVVEGHKDNPPIGVTNYMFQEDFYVELVESTVFDLVQGLYPDRGNDEPWSGSGSATSFYRNGMLEEGMGGSEVSLLAGSDSIGHYHLYINSDLSKWEIGSTVSLDNRTVLNGGLAGETSSFRSGLTLTAISNTNPAANSDITLVSGDSDSEGGMPHSVPEPSTFLLMGIGLIGLGARRFIKTA
ncbi:MAG: PEP-CTERM sorting domain-containing protein [Candidatus Thiodiazotropha sp.]